jgi:alpha-tubulin suppressor-like RCC1 family protein
MPKTIDTALEHIKPHMDNGAFVYKYKNSTPIAAHRDWIEKTWIDDSIYKRHWRDVFVVDERAFYVLTDTSAVVCGQQIGTGYDTRNKNSDGNWVQPVGDNDRRNAQRIARKIQIKNKYGDKVDLKDIKKIVGDVNTVLYLTYEGKLYGAGNNRKMMGLDSGTDPVIDIIRLTDFDDIVDVVCGRGFAIIKRSDGTYWGAGDNSKGQLGTGQLTNVRTEVQTVEIPYTPTDEYPTSTEWLASFDSGGANYGLPKPQWPQYKETIVEIVTNIDYSDKFIHITNLDGCKIVDVGLEHMIAVFDDNEPDMLTGQLHKGRVKVCGSNSHGQLGLNLPVGSQIIDFQVIQNVENITLIGCKDSYGSFLYGNNKCYCAGYNVYGQMGLGYFGKNYPPAEKENMPKPGINNVPIDGRGVDELCVSLFQEFQLPSKKEDDIVEFCVNVNLTAIRTKPDKLPGVIDYVYVTGYGKNRNGINAVDIHTWTSIGNNILSVKRVFRIGVNFIYAIRDTGDSYAGIWCIGANAEGQLNLTNESPGYGIEPTNPYGRGQFQLVSYDFNITEAVSKENYVEVRLKSMDNLKEVVGKYMINSDDSLRIISITDTDLIDANSNKIIKIVKEFCVRDDIIYKWDNLCGNNIIGIYYKNNHGIWIDWMKMKSMYPTADFYATADLPTTEETFRLDVKHIPKVNYTDANGQMFIINEKDNYTYAYNDIDILNSITGEVIEYSFIDINSLGGAQPLKHHRSDLKIEIKDDHIIKDKWLGWLNGAFVDIIPDENNDKIGYIKNAAAIIPAVEKCKSSTTPVSLSTNNATVNEKGDKTELRWDIKLKLFGWKGVKVKRQEKHINLFNKTGTYKDREFMYADVLQYATPLVKDTFLLLLNGQIMDEDLYEIDLKDPRRLYIKGYYEWIIKSFIEGERGIPGNYFDRISDMISNNQFTIVRLESEDPLKTAYFFKDRACVKNMPYIGDVTFPEVKYGDLVCVDGHYKQYEWCNYRSIRYPDKAYSARSDLALELADIYKIKTYLV